MTDQVNLSRNYVTCVEWTVIIKRVLMILPKTSLLFVKIRKDITH